MCISRLIFLKELIPVVMASPKSAGYAGRLEPQGRALQFESKLSLPAEFFSAQRRLVFVLLKPSSDWMRPMHMMESNLLCSKSIKLNLNLIQKRPSLKHENHVLPNI